MLNLYSAIRPALFRMEPEQAHRLTLSCMKRGLFPRFRAAVDPALETTLWGLKFPGPVGLAAGFDKNAEVIGPAFRLGFGFVEAGTVTPRPQAGNPPPRIFRDPAHEAIINRMGFPNDGMHAFKANLERFLGGRHRPGGVIGLNIGMNKTQSEPVKDYALLIRMLGPMADYITVNISSPNTPGLRELQKRDHLLKLLGTLKEEREKSCRGHSLPLLVKFAPDLEDGQQREIAQTLLEAEIDGMILTNTTLARPAFLPGDFRKQQGGLSGRPLADKSTDIIRNFYRLTGGKLPIIGVGGISGADDAYAKIRAGASLVQLYSALVFRGPSVASSISRGLAARLKADGLKHISEAVGADSHTDE